MSTDLVAVCDDCREEIHLGQRMGHGYSFGYGSNDEQGRSRVFGWLLEHCDQGHRVRVLMSQSVAHEATHYTRPEWDL